MISKNTIRKALAWSLIAVTMGVTAQTVSLPTIKMQGKEYYYYRVKKSDSPYGICKKYGWDEEILRSLNANMGTKIAKGQTIYYPVTIQAVETPVIGRIEPVNVAPEPVTHTVGRGETIYSISKLYSVPVDLIYNANPDARNGLKIGDKLSILQPVYNTLKGQSPFFYTVQAGDNLTKIAEMYNTDVASLMEQNPGMSERRLQIGQNIRVIPNNRNITQVKEVREITTVSGFVPYKISKGDTWESIAATNNITPEVLKSANDATELPKKGGWIVVPQYKSETLETIIESPVQAENTLSERDEIYRTVHNINPLKQVEVAVVLEKPAAKNNADFLRGFLMGVDDLKTNGSKIHLTVVDASKGLNNNNTDSILNASNLIVGVYDNEFPAHIAELGRKKGIEVVNVLDSKSSLYEINPAMIQLLQPIDYFNELTAGYIYEKNPGAQLMLLGEIDNSDRFADFLMHLYPSSQITRLPVDEFAVYPFNPTEQYVVYNYALKKDGISESLTAISEAQDKGVNIIPVGRPQWVANAQALSELYGKTGVLVPSRVYTNPFDAKQNGFNERFKTIYKSAPVVSYPQYGMLGYDVASYFIPTTAGNGGDYNNGVIYLNGLQNDIDIKRINNWSGFINRNGYILHYLPEQIIEKIEVK